MTRLQTPTVQNHNLALIAIFFFAFGLRLWSIQFGLPELYHADEPIIVNHALAYGTGDLNPHFFKIPPLISYLLFFVYGIFFVVGKLTGYIKSADDFLKLFITDPTLFYFSGRLLFGTFLGALSVSLWHHVISRHFDPRRALISALLFSVAFVHVSDSHYIYADIPLVFCLLLTFSATLNLNSGSMSSLASHAAIGALIGLSAATKYNGVFIFIPYVFILIARSHFRFKAYVVPLVIAGLSSCIVFFILNPYGLLDAATFLQELKAQSAANQGVSFLHHLTYSLREGLGMPLLGLVAVAVIALIPKFKQITDSQNSARYAIALFSLSYYLVLVKWGQPYGRYVLPLIPFLIFLAVDCSVNLFQSASLKRWGWLAGFVLVIAFSQNLWKSVQFNLLMAQTDTRSLAKSWMMANIPAGSKIALDLDFAMPQLPVSKDEISKRIEWAKSQPGNQESRVKRLIFLASNQSHQGYILYTLANRDAQTPQTSLDNKPIQYDLSELRKEGVEYVVTGRFWEKDLNQFFYDQLDREATVINRFNPYKNSASAWALEHPLTGGPFMSQDISLRARNGYPLTVYRLEQGNNRSN